MHLVGKARLKFDVQTYTKPSDGVQAVKLRFRTSVGGDLLEFSMAPGEAVRLATALADAATEARSRMGQCGPVDAVRAAL